MLRKYRWAALAVVFILLGGTIGYWLITGRQSSLFDAFYMTLITITTIGYGEIIDLSNHPAGRVFTIFVAASGIGVLFYLITGATASVVEGELTKSFRRNRMEKRASNLKSHYIVCGAGDVGCYIAQEMSSTGRQFVIVESNPGNVERVARAFPKAILLEGDATDDATLQKAGITTAQGLFAVTGDDNQNLVVSLTAKGLNPALRIVAQCTAVSGREKMRRAGADAVVSPDFIGGLRMASEMVRPTVVSFLDTMLRETAGNLRIEEVQLPAWCTGQHISQMRLERYTHSVLLALKTAEGWIYNPPKDHVIQPETALVLMTNPEERLRLESDFAAGKG